MTTSKNILFLMTGSIACYKACDLVSKLVKNNYKVKCVLSHSAIKFIGVATLEGLTGEPVYTDTFETGKMMSHIDLARWADLILVCPSSANTTNSFAAGVAQGLIGEIFLSNNFQKPFWIAPAMNSQMLLHPATQESLQKLKKWGCQILETGAGELACGEYGVGRLLEPQNILDQINSFFRTSKLKDLEI